MKHSDHSAQTAFVKALDDYQWETGEAHPGLTWKLLIDADRVDTDGFSFGILRFSPGAQLPAHRHSPQESYFILEGEGLLQIGEETSAVKAGTIVDIPRNFTHGIKNVGSENLSLMWTFPTDTWAEVEYLFRGNK